MEDSCFVLLLRVGRCPAGSRTSTCNICGYAAFDAAPQFWGVAAVVEMK